MHYMEDNKHPFLQMTILRFLYLYEHVNGGRQNACPVVILINNSNNSKKFLSPIMRHSMDLISSSISCLREYVSKAASLGRFR